MTSDIEIVYLMLLGVVHILLHTVIEQRRLQYPLAHALLWLLATSSVTYPCFNELTFMSSLLLLFSIATMVSERKVVLDYVITAAVFLSSFGLYFQALKAEGLDSEMVILFMPHITVAVNSLFIEFNQGEEF